MCPNQNHGDSSNRVSLDVFYHLFVPSLPHLFAQWLTSPRLPYLDEHPTSRALETVGSPPQTAVEKLLCRALSSQETLMAKRRQVGIGLVGLGFMGSIRKTRAGELWVERIADGVRRRLSIDGLDAPIIDRSYGNAIP